MLARFVRRDAPGKTPSERFSFWVDGRGDYSRDKGEDAGKSKMRVERCPPQASSAEALHFAGLFVVHPCAKASVVCGAKARMHGQRM